MERAEWERYKATLVEMRSRLIREVSAIETAIVEDVAAPGDLSSVPVHPADRDAEGVENNLALAHNEAGLLEDVEAALERIERGGFGRCEDCGQPIARERLDLLPYTPHCVGCAQSHQAEAAAEVEDVRPRAREKL